MTERLLEKVMGKLTEQKLVNSNLFVKELELLAKDATRSIDQKKIDLGTEALINFLTKSPVMKKLLDCTKQATIYGKLTVFL